jgi:hypothetical protein
MKYGWSVDWTLTSGDISENTDYNTEKVVFYKLSLRCKNIYIFARVTDGYIIPLIQD